MSTAYNILALFVVLVTIANAQVPKFGSCPQYKLADNFDPAAYFTGKFYEQKRFWNLFEVGSKCVHAEYSLEANGTVRVENSGFSTTKNRFSQIGEAYCEKDSSSACNVRFYPGTPYGKYHLLAADPAKYGLVFSCTQVIPGVLNTQFAWILTREKKVSDADMQKYLDVFKANGIDISLFADIDQDCEDN